MCAELPRSAGTTECAETRALRVLLSLAVPPTDAALHLEGSLSPSEGLWPSELFQMVAERAVRSPRVWFGCEEQLNQRLAGSLRGLECLCPAELTTRFHQGRARLPALELAAIVWCLARRRQPAFSFVSARLAAELELVVTARYVMSTAASAGRPYSSGAPSTTPA